MKTAAYFLFFFFALNIIQAQVYSNFTDTVSSPTKEIYQLWRNYMTQRKAADAMRYWDEKEVKQYKACDILLAWGCGGTFATESHVVKIKKRGADIYELKIAMGAMDDSNHPFFRMFRRASGSADRTPSPTAIEKLKLNSLS